MRKFMLFTVAVLLLVLPAAAALAADVTISPLNFPDEHFRDYLYNEVDLDCDGALSTTERNRVTKMNVNDRMIEDLTGIGYFKNLVELRCTHNLLVELDLKKLTALKVLDCSYNSLDALDLSNNTALTTLICHHNAFQTFNVSKNTALVTLDCASAQIKSLNVSKNTKLKTLDCSDNELKTLDLKKNTKLTELDCADNQLKALDVSKNADLVVLNCNANQLTALNVSALADLEKLYCCWNEITALDVSKNAKLAVLDCGYNKLTSLNLKGNPLLTDLYCRFNSLKALDLSKNTQLKNLNCSNNHLVILDLMNNPKVVSVLCEYQTPRSVTAEAGRIFFSDLGLTTARVWNVVGADVGEVAVDEDGFLVFKSGWITYEYEARPGIRICFTIKVKYVKAKLDTVKIVHKKNSYPFAGKPIMPEVNVKAKINGHSVMLTCGFDYTVSYKDNFNAGTATITVKGRGHFKGTLTTTFTIAKVSLQSLTLSKGVMKYTGKALKPKVTVKARVNGLIVPLIRGEDFTVKYEDNVEKGTATVTVTGKGNFKGTIQKTFKIR